MSYHKYIRYFIKKYIDSKYKILDVGMGDASKYSIKLSENKEIYKYIGLEVHRPIYIKANYNCNKYNCNIKIFNRRFEDFNPKIKFNVILFINSLHFMDTEKAINKAYNILDNNGMIIIREPPIKPNNWGINIYNKSSDKFDKIKWEKKKKQLKKTKRFLLTLQNVKYYPENNFYILRKLNM